MGIALYENHFSTGDEALKEIEADGLWALPVEFPPDRNQSHWHDFDAHLFILEGVLNLTDASKNVAYRCSAGVKVVVPARSLHSEDHDGYKVVFGLSVDLTTHSRPINLPPEQL